MDILNEVRKVLPEEKIAHHYSDLYCKSTPETEAILSNWEFKNQASHFIDNIDHELWIEFPFCYHE